MKATTEIIHGDVFSHVLRGSLHFAVVFVVTVKSTDSKRTLTSSTCAVKDASGSGGSHFVLTAGCGSEGEPGGCDGNVLADEGQSVWTSVRSGFPTKH